MSTQRPRRHWRPAWVALLLALAAPSVRAQAPVPETQAKAAFVLNFARYVEWPEAAFASREAPLVICVVGSDAGAFADLANRQAQSRAVRVRRIAGSGDAQGCHVAFFTDSDARRIGTQLRSLTGRPILTVGDADGFIDQGGAIGLVQSEQRLQFEVNRGALDSAQLKASSQLLKLARAVLSPRD